MEKEGIYCTLEYLVGQNDYVVHSIKLMESWRQYCEDNSHNYVNEEVPYMQEGDDNLSNLPMDI